MDLNLVESVKETAAIEFRNVGLTFDEKPILRDISFQLARGEMIVITGASGSGMSVLLHLAIGLLRPDEGQIFVAGHEIERLSETELLGLRSRLMGIVFQEDTLFTALTVYDNTAYRLVEHDWPEEKIDPAVEEILRFVGLENDMEKIPEELSIGMRRRLEIARALAGWPPIMLFDEPTSGLDPINSRQVLDLVIRARDIYDISSLYVTKELHEIPYLETHRAVKDASGAVAIGRCEQQTPSKMKVMVLEKGRLVFSGSPDEFASSRLPAVTNLTDPGTGVKSKYSYAPDPWSKSRKPE